MEGKYEDKRHFVFREIPVYQPDFGSVAEMLVKDMRLQLKKEGGYDGV